MKALCTRCRGTAAPGDTCPCGASINKVIDTPPRNRRKSQGLHLPVTFVEFDVFGIPASQGSMARARGGRMYHTDKNLAAWRKSVRKAAEASGAPCVSDFVPVYLGVIFFLPRDAKLKTPRQFPCARDAGTKDLDKLLRAVGDGLGGVVVSEDTRITSIYSQKVFADDREPGAHIGVGTDPHAFASFVARVSTVLGAHDDN